MAILALNKLSLAYLEKPVLCDCSLSLEARCKVGLVGANGAGKTSLFRLLTGEIAPTGGEIITPKGFKIGIMEQELKNHSHTLWQELASLFEHLHRLEEELEDCSRRLEQNPTGAQQKRLLEQQYTLNEQFLEQGGLTYQSRIRSTLLGLGFGEADFQRRLGELSGGQRSKLALAKLLLSDADLLLLDEPTNHLDVASLEWLEDFLRSLKAAFIVISHDRFFLDRVCEQTIHLFNHHLKLYKGNFSEFKRQSQAALEADMRHNANINREISRLEGIIKQQKQWNREKTLITAHSKEKALARLQTQLTEVDQPPPDFGFRFAAAPASGQDLLELTELDKTYGQQQILEGLNFRLHKGERVFLLGPNGAGKTTLFRLIIRQITPDSGEIRHGAGLKIGYYDQVQKLDAGAETILEHLRSCYPKCTETELRSALALFLFYAEDIEKPCQVLSGGEKARLGLLKILLGKPNLLLLDEPTNHLDIAGREALEQALAHYDGAILAISHDRYFINALAERVVVLEQRRLTEYPGNYSYYLEKRANTPPATEPGPQPVQEPPTPAKQDYQARKEQASQQRRRQNRLTKVEQTIAQLEEAKAQLESDLANPQIASDYPQIAEINAQLEHTQSQLDQLLEEWANLAEQIEEASRN